MKPISHTSWSWSPCPEGHSQFLRRDCAQSFCSSCHGQGINIFKRGEEVVATSKSPHREDPLRQALR